MTGGFIAGWNEHRDLVQIGVWQEHLGFQVFPTAPMGATGLRAHRRKLGYLFISIRISLPFIPIKK
ncbi:hypothetical protein NOC27_1598 [Nitrosococcus oceani AFC27]|uniref:Uncharacterized protein n=1 Tax=Nitrosococcus oceani C-27 TaxID=314279 RepID=A0A0E2Z2A3_9GAMM|nr:hypothetical protein NOC27_1598 [Nitrosococcus oceani AFC27]KFI19331.1 hypothetical protein IB75_09275 [Nitrosococcus oceani C-27]KFI22645.1 hypothetical protein HW44_08455 [Nitrosococcus oceani]